MKNFFKWSFIANIRLDTGVILQCKLLKCIVTMKTKFLTTLTRLLDFLGRLLALLRGRRAK